VHQYYDALGRRRERYLAGSAGSDDAEATAEEVRSRIEDVRGVLPSLRLLGREGFQFVDSRAFATIAAIHNRGLFARGIMLIGSHAYGAIVNRLGIRVAAYRTEDIDIARAAPLAIAGSRPQPLLETARESGIDFVEVPQLDAGQPSTSFKQRGRSTFQLDFLAPGRGEMIGSVRVPELEAHALTLPYLGYLLAESQRSAVLAREGCCAVRVPIPERFAIHKLIVSALRPGRSAKALRDRAQAAALSAALAELHPGAVEAALRDVPRRALPHLRQTLAALRRDLETRHPRAWEELATALPRR
jgi:hypothetical protein